MVDPAIAKALEGLVVEPMPGPGDFQPIKDTKEEEVVKDTQIAVDMYNKLNHGDLSLAHIVKGQRRWASGVVYDMVIAATNGNSYQLEFWLTLTEECEIMSFQHLTS